MMIKSLGTTVLVFGVLMLGSLPIAAQWPTVPDPNAPRDAKGKLRGDAPTPRTPDGKPDFSGLWMHANSGPPGGGRGRQGGAPAGATRGGRGGIPVDLTILPFPFDPNGPPVATFFEAGANMEGGLPYTQWARDIRKKRLDDLQARDNPDANCLPMGFLQFHQQPQPRRIMNVSNPKMLLIEYEANNGLCHVYMDGRNFRRVELTNAARVDAAAVTLRGRLPPGEQLRRQKAGADVADRCQPPVRPRESAARQPIDTPHICRGRDPPANFHSGAPAPRPSSAAPAHRSLRRRKAGT
jgi:hypothetical protein